MTLQELKSLIWTAIKMTLLMLIFPFLAYVLLPLRDGGTPEFTKFYEYLVSPLFLKIPFILLLFGISLIAGGLFYLVHILLFRNNASRCSD